MQSNISLFRTALLLSVVAHVSRHARSTATHDSVNDHLLIGSRCAGKGPFVMRAHTRHCNMSFMVAERRFNGAETGDGPVAKVNGSITKLIRRLLGESSSRGPPGALLRRGGSRS